MKKISIKDLYIDKKFYGEKIEVQGFIDKFQKKDENMGIIITHNDKTLSVIIPLESLTFELKEKIFVTISGTVIPYMNGPLLKAKTIQESIPSNEEMLGLSEEKIKEYLSVIKSVRSLIKNAEYNNLLDICLSDENLNKLATLPATIFSSGNYPGGALAQTAVVTLSVKDLGSLYRKYKNEAYDIKLNWDALLTASLLHLFGNTYFYTLGPEGFEKTKIGLLNGYYGTLEYYLTNIAKDVVSELNFSLLLNILAGSVQGGNKEVRAVTSEGSILKYAINSYAAYDLTVSEIVRLSSKSEREDAVYAYSERLECQVLLEDGGKKE